MIKVNPVKVDDEAYYTVRDFAYLTNRSESVIYGYISKGNAIRKLKRKTLFGHRVFIPASELTEFPFTPIGAGAAKRFYYFDEEGQIKESTA